jgi:four helix bundle suffix protein
MVQAARSGVQNIAEGSEASATSKKNRPSDASTKATLYAELSANAALVLIAVACSLLDRQVAALAKQFEEEGGFTEKLYRVRSAQRRNNRQ